MDLTRFFIKHLLLYLATFLTVIIIYGVIIYTADIFPADIVEQSVLAAALFLYPFFLLIKGTAETLTDWLDRDSDVRMSFFAHVCERIIPERFEHSRRLIFTVNMISKFLQFIAAIAIIYAFIANDASLFRDTVIAIVAFAVVSGLLLLRIPILTFMKTRQGEFNELTRAQEEAGFPLDPDRISAFMKKPFTIFAANIVYALIGVALLAVQPALFTNPFVRAFLVLFRTTANFSIVMLPFTAFYLGLEYVHSRMYQIEVGKGEYGQIKVEFWEYQGTGDEREKVRNKIDRLEQMDIGPRYIKVVKGSAVWPVKIPRTMINEDLLIEALEIIRV